MSERYIDELDDEKRIILSEALSNTTLLNRNIVTLDYKSPYDIFARTPLNASFSDGLAVWDDFRTYI